MDVIRYKLEEYSSMSHLISESKNSLPTIFIPEKCEVAPKYQKLIKSLPKKSKMILNQTLTPKQSLYVKQRSEGWINRHFKKIEYNEMISQRIHESSEKQVELIQLKNMRKKYQKQLSERIRTLQEARAIQYNKSTFISWLNQTNNSLTNSANFNKMNFLLEKLKKKQSTPLSDHSSQKYGLTIPKPAFIPPPHPYKPSLTKTQKKTSEISS